MKGHWSREHLWEALRASQDLPVTSVLSFPKSNKKLYLNPKIWNMHDIVTFNTVVKFSAVLYKMYEKS